MKLSAFTRYGPLGASSRVRLMQYQTALLSAGIEVHVSPLLDDRYLLGKYAGKVAWSRVIRSYVARLVELLSLGAGTACDVMWIEKELWPWVPAWLEHTALKNMPVVLDYDDAIFHNYDLARSPIVRALLGRKIDRLMARAALVTAGNAYLADRARQAGAKWVEVLPTVIDLDRYPLAPPRATASSADAVVIGWIGSPATVGYLQQLAEPLRRLASENRVRLHVIGGGAVQLPGVEVMSVPWAESSEVDSISQCDIGVMPLHDSPWERGKCGYKLIQYMACGLPVVASPVGVNTSIVREGVSGLLAANPGDWFSALQSLTRDAPMRARFGAAGRARVEAEYCLQVAAPRLAQWLHTMNKGTN